MIVVRDMPVSADINVTPPRPRSTALIGQDWKIWMIDHTRAFKIFDKLKDAQRLANTCEKDLLQALRSLDKARLLEAMDDLPSAGQVNGLLARRDETVKRYDGRLAELGEDQVLYDLTAVPASRP